MKKFLGFTLAEVMIVLVVIGIISAIIMPIAIQSVPDKNIMLFKKGHNTLYQVISTLVNSDEYYKDGNLAIRPNGNYITGSNSGDTSYFCNSFADNVATKSTNCTEHARVSYLEVSSRSLKGFVCSDWSENDIGSIIDEHCKKFAKDFGKQIVTSDGIVFYQASDLTYGMDDYTSYPNYVFLQTVGYFNEHTTTAPAKGTPSAYRCSPIFCMDIDGFSSEGSEACDDKNDICPFGYAIRTDGKIYNGSRVREWLDKELSQD